MSELQESRRLELGRSNLRLRCTKPPRRDRDVSIIGESIGNAHEIERRH